MLKRLKTVSMMLFLLGTSTGAAFAVSAPGADDVKIVQQSGTATGTVVDAMGPVIGASVVVKGTTNGIITDFDGNFSLSNVKKGDVLVISFVGYQTVEVKWEGTPLSITLKDDTQALEEVVVIGYGGVQKAKTMTASAATVKVGELAKLPVASMSEGLGGRVTGVITQQASGAPGENARIWVRGGEKILYVIDDVVMESEQGNEFFNRLRPDDIASMSVLKDAAATAVYGPRAANGVVVIATKRGQDGAPTITVNQKVSMMTPSYRAEVMNAYDYVRLRNELYFTSFEENPYMSDTELSKYYMGYLNQNGYEGNYSAIRELVNKEYGLNYSLTDIENLFDPYKAENGRNIQDYYQTYDAWDQFDHTQPMYQTNIGIRGGSERLKYYSSLGYLKQNGYSETYQYEQINFILNTDSYLLKDKSLKFTFNLNGNTTMKETPSDGDGLFTSALFGHTMATRPAVWSNGKPRKGSVASRLNTGFNTTEAYRFQMNAALKWNLPWVEGLSAQGSINFTTSYDTNRAFSHNEEGVYDSPAADSFSTYNPDQTTMSQRWSKYKLLTGIFQIDYTKSIGKHNFNVMANYQSQIRKTNDTQAKRYGFPTTLTPQVGQGAAISGIKDGGANGSATEWGSASYIGRLTYDYANKYMLQYSANYNGSLSYSPDKRWGYFHAISLGWVMSDEDWFKELVNPDILKMLKLRGGWGVVGNEVGTPFSYLTQYEQNANRILLGKDMTSNVGWYMSKLANDLEWSSSTQWGAGVDFELFKGKLQGSFDTYLYLNKGDVMNMTAEMLQTDILGMPNVPQINAPFVTKRKGGFEVSLNWMDKIGEVGYRLGLNYSYWDERVTRHTTKSTNYYTPTWDTVGKRTMQETYKYYYPTFGLHTSWEEMYNSFLHPNRTHTLGTLKVYDLYGDGSWGYDRMWNNKPGAVPLTQYGITVGADYKGFDFELFFQGATDVTGAMPSPLRSNEDWMWNYGQYAYQNAYTPWNPDGNAAIPLPVSSGRAYGGVYMEHWVFDASYFKLKNISLRYDMKKYLLKDVDFVQGLDLSFVVTNAFTWTKKSYPLKGFQDPEFITTGANIYAGRSGTLGTYPTQRSYTLGVTLTL